MPHLLPFSVLFEIFLEVIVSDSSSKDCHFVQIFKYKNLKDTNDLVMASDEAKAQVRQTEACKIQNYLFTGFNDDVVVFEPFV